MEAIMEEAMHDEILGEAAQRVLWPKVA